MAPKHDEIVRQQADGWTVAWDANTVEPATRKAFDKVIADNARALREVLHGTSDRTPSGAARATAHAQSAHALRARRARPAA
jgi:ferric-dicitrate binding protein FerR (iron transport regulator)